MSAEVDRVMNEQEDALYAFEDSVCEFIGTTYKEQGSVMLNFEGSKFNVKVVLNGMIAQGTLAKVEIADEKRLYVTEAHKGFFKQKPLYAQLNCYVEGPHRDRVVDPRLKGVDEGKGRMSTACVDVNSLPSWAVRDSHGDFRVTTESGHTLHFNTKPAFEWDIGLGC
jgi:hypothetical protein